MTLLEFKNVSRGDSERTVLRAVSFSVEPGEKLVLFGRSGSGKRTFLKLAAGILAPTSGTVTLRDPRPGRPMPVGYAVNDGGLLNNLTLVQNAALPAVYHQTRGLTEAEGRARELLEEWGLGVHEERRPASAVAAELRLARLARAVLSEPALFVLEDPLEDMDSATALRLKKALDRILGDKEAAVLLATERPRRFFDHAGRFLLLADGEVRVFEGRAALLAAEDPEVRLFLD